MLRVPFLSIKIFVALTCVMWQTKKQMYTAHTAEAVEYADAISAEW